MSLAEWALVLVLAAALAWVIVHKLRGGNRRVEAALEGPDTLALLEELDAHLEEYVAADPEMAARFDRLWAAIHDEQQKGDQQ
jgi:hypothetical protein